MIPFDIQYSSSIKKNFANDVEWFSKFLSKYSDNSPKTRQLLILSTEEFHDYLEIVKKYSSEIESAFGGCCAYCESKDIVSLLPIHPLEKNRDFPELAQEIRNILPFCKQCRKVISVFNYTKNYKLTPTSNSFDKLILKRPNVLIPIQEPTHLYLEYKTNGEVYGSTDKSKRTLKICGINEKSRLVKRSEMLAKTKLEFNKSKSESINYYCLWSIFKGDERNWESGYSAAKSIEISFNSVVEDFDKQLVIQQAIASFHGENVFEPIRYTPIKKDTPIDLDSFEFKNLRCIRNGRIDLSNKKSIGVIGENGVGKSTILDFLSATIRGTLKAKIQQSNDGFLSPSERTASGCLKGINQYYEFENNVFSVKSEESLYKCEADIQEKLRVAFINDQRIHKENITSAEKWLIGLSEENFDIVSSQIKQVLEIEYDSVLIREKSEVLVQSHNSPNKSLSVLSSGYKSILAIIYSIYKQFGSTYRLSSQYVNLDSVVGVVFIDEIDLHLHPIWKLNIVSRLKRVFPDILFIFTTHDPLVLKGCNYGEVVLLSRQKDGTTKVNQDLPDLSKYSSERILTSRYFGLGSSSNMEDNNDLLGLYESIRDENKEKALNTVKSLKSIGLYGNTYRELIAFMCVDRSLAKNEPIDVVEIVKIINEKVSSND